MSTFEALTKKQVQAPLGTCPRCHSGETAGSVGIAVRQRTPGQKSGDKTIASTSKALCEPCAVQIYEEMQGLFVDMINQPRRS